MSLEDALSTPSDDTPEMPTARRVGNRRIRETAPAFNEVTVELSVVLGRCSRGVGAMVRPPAPVLGVRGAGSWATPCGCGWPRARRCGWVQRW